MIENDKEDRMLKDGVSLNINSTGPHYEHISEFSNSFFKLVYKRAFLQVDDIISNFNQNNEYGLGKYVPSYYADNKAGVGKGFDRFSNIITFAGKRGSGKTSAMLSFMDALKHYYGYKKRNGEELFYTFKYVDNPLFTCLDCIDGSLLEHGEDIFKVVLAQIYQKFIDLDERGGISKGEDFAFKKRELFQKLEGIYGTVCEIENMENRYQGASESHMSNLQSLSSSQKVKRDFEDLIKKFTFLMKYERRGMVEESQEHYVIISIDDIDLNISNGFSMLEKIHRYCMVENVIVLLSVDMEQMLSIVSKSFYEVLPKVDKILIEGNKRVHELATDYLSKVMPVNYRIFVPCLSSHYSTNGLFLPKEKSGVKRAVFWKLYRRIGIYFDSQGIKQHFYESKSMRQLTCFYLMLESMEHISLDDVYFKSEITQEQRESLIQIWEENYRILTEELSNRIVLEELHIDREVDEICKIIEKQDISRAKDEVVNFCYNKIGSASSENNQIEMRNREVHMENCTYGQLVEALYELGRINRNKYKPLVRYLLGYFSYAFTKTYIYEKLEVENDGKRLMQKGAFKSLVGGNIVDDWSMFLMPNTVRNRNMDVDEQGAASGDKSNKVLEYFSNYRGVTLANMFSFPLEKKGRLESEERVFRYVAEMIQNMELLFLFFTNIREEGQKGNINIKSDSFLWKFRVYKTEDMNSWISFDPRVENFSEIALSGDYSVLNFVGNSMDAVKLLTKFENGLAFCLAGEYGLLEQMESGEEKLKADFEKTLNDYSLKIKFEEWEDKFGTPALPLPLYWFDLTYNILKRMKRAMSEEFIVSSKTENMFFCIQKLYENIVDQLKEQESFYSLKGMKPDESSYEYQLAERFTTCPVVDYFLGVTRNGEEEKRKSFISEVMVQLKNYSKA